MKMYIYSKFGVLDCVPMTLQKIEDSTLQAEEEINSTVTAANQEETKAASESCCEISHPDSDGAADIDEPDKI